MKQIELKTFEDYVNPPEEIEGFPQWKLNKWKQLSKLVKHPRIGWISTIFIVDLVREIITKDDHPLVDKTISSIYNTLRSNPGKKIMVTNNVN